MTPPQTDRDDPTLEDAGLRDFLPLRSGLQIADYHALLMDDFQRIILDSLPEQLCRAAGAAAVLFSADTADAGQSATFAGCSPEGLRFSGGALPLRAHPGKHLVFLEVPEGMYSFFTDFRAQRGEHLLFSPPPILYQRPTRLAKRMRLQGPLILLRKNGQQHAGMLHDFSLTGASFFTGTDTLALGEALLIDFDVMECGRCETVVTVLRKEARDARLKHLVAVRLLLTKAQRKKVEYLFLCHKYPQLRNHPPAPET